MNSEEAASYLTGLLERYSPSGKEENAVRFMVESLEGAGFAARVDPAGNAVASRGDGAKEILLLGHIDTVAGVIPIRKEGVDLYGRGAVDAKGCLACFAAAASRLEIPDGWRVTVIGAVGEEADSPGATYLRDHREPPAALVIGEPSGWNRVTLGFKGTQWVRYRVETPLGHTAGQNASACEIAFEFWQKLLDHSREYNAAVKGVFHQITPTLREMSSSCDGFIEKAELKIGLRLPPALPPAGMIEIVAGLKTEGECDYSEGLPAYAAGKNTPLVRAFLGSIRENGGEPVFSYKTGTADMNIVAPKWGCQTLAYGPGDSNLDHTPNEHLSLTEYERSIQILAGALERLFQAG